MMIIISEDFIQIVLFTSIVLLVTNNGDIKFRTVLNKMNVSGLDPRLNTCIDFAQQSLPEAGITFHCESLQPLNCANTGPLPPPPPHTI